jgi:hypothetical protein
MLAACSILLAACGDTDQSKTSSNTNRNDVAAWEGAKNNFVTVGWTPGNKSSWEAQLRTRNQLQNEYQKTN